MAPVGTASIKVVPDFSAFAQVEATVLAMQICGAFRGLEAGIKFTDARVAAERLLERYTIMPKADWPEVPSDGDPHA